jgi:two-component system response regulator PhoP
MRVLVVEDEAPLREQIVRSLRQAGNVVDHAGDGAEGLYLGNEFPVDVAIVDLGLPDMSGLELVRRWRQAGRTFPILILTARGRWQEKVEGLETGADDYLVKPVRMEEVQARLKALVRRSAGWADATLTAGVIVLDTAAQRVQVGDRAVELTAYEYKLLEYLMVHAGTVLSKTVLAEHLYDDQTDRDSNVLEVLLARLRRKLDPGRKLNPIETLRGRGYRLRLERKSRP